MLDKILANNLTSTIGNIFFSTVFRPVLGSNQPPIECVPGAPSPEIKRQGSEVHHSPATSAEVKNAGTIPSLATGTNLPFYAWLRGSGSGVITLEPVPEASSTIDCIILGVTVEKLRGRIFQ
jgi:hypothetical protein